jgi:hypothetical protein
MKRIVIFFLTGCFLLGFSITICAAEGTKSSSEKSVTESITGTAKEVKEGTVKVYKESKDAIVRDAKAIKEDVPKGLKEAKDSAVKQSKEVKEGAKQEFKEIRDNMANPKLTPKSESK